MSSLELRLSSLRDELAFPETPDLVAGVEGAIAAGARPQRRWNARPLAIAVAVLVAVAAGVLAFSPGARSAFLEIFQLKGATVERVEELPDVPTTGRLDLGERVSRAEAERRVGFELLDLGTPDAVFVRDDSIATLVYGSVENPRLVLSQLRGRSTTASSRRPLNRHEGRAGDRARRAGALRLGRRALRHVHGRAGLHHRRADLPRREHAALEPRRPAPPPRGRPSRDEALELARSIE